jgi:AcrR family transcriptional regulator
VQAAKVEDVATKESAAQPFAFNDRRETVPAGDVPLRVQRTRTRLSKALVELLGERQYDQVSVQDIVSRAGIIRGTFYLHFGEKNDLFGYVMREAAEEFLSLLSAPVASEPVSRKLLIDRYSRILLHIQANAVLYRTALCEPGAAPYATYFHDALQAFSVEAVRASAPGSVAKNEDKVRMIGQFSAAGLTGLWRWWLETGMAVPVTTVAAQTADLMLIGPLASADIHLTAPTVRTPPAASLGVRPPRHRG